MSAEAVPKALRRWFLAHFMIDIAFAVPLLFIPVPFLAFLGWTSVDPLATRLVGAALVGIGGESLLGRDGSLQSYRATLRLKVLWSLAANIAIALSIAEGSAPPVAKLFLALFTAFFGIWLYYFLRLRDAT